MHTISTHMLKQWLDHGEAVLIDVREPAEYAAEHIEGAVSVPLSTVCCPRLPKTDKKVVFQCRRGARGESACRKLMSEDPGRHVYNLEGGIEAWQDAGLPIVISGRKVLPLDRQVQLTVGLLVLLGSLLAYAAGPVFLLLTGAIGVGLSIAGLTGFCGLAYLMARMPWNQAKADCRA